MIKLKCPLCNGEGKINPPKFRNKWEGVDMQEIAFILKESGYTYREIVKLLNLKHPGSVSHLLEMHEINHK